MLDHYGVFMYSQLLGMLKQVDTLSPGVWGQPGRHSKVMKLLIIEGGVVGKDGEEEGHSQGKWKEEGKGISPRVTRKNTGLLSLWIQLSEKFFWTWNCRTVVIFSLHWTLITVGMENVYRGGQCSGDASKVWGAWSLRGQAGHWWPSLQLLKLRPWLTA